MSLGSLATGPSNNQRKDGEATSHVQQLLERAGSLLPCRPLTVTIQDLLWRQRGRRSHMEQLKVRLQSQELDNLGTSGVPAVKPHPS